MSEGNPTNPSKPESPLDAAKARAAAADAERQAAQKFVNEMTEVANKGDNTADQVMAEARDRLDAAAMEVENSHIALGRLVMQAKAEREASTPIDELLMGSAAPAGQASLDELEHDASLAQWAYHDAKSDPNMSTRAELSRLKAERDAAQDAFDRARARDTPSTPGTPVEDLMWSGVGTAAPSAAEDADKFQVLAASPPESPQPDEFESRPLPPDPEAEPELDLDIDTELEPETAAPRANGPSRTAIVAIGGLAIIGVGIVGAILLMNNGAGAALPTIPASASLLALPSATAEISTAPVTATPTDVPLPTTQGSVAAGSGIWTLQGITGETAGTYDDQASSASGTLSFDPPQMLTVGQTYRVTATFSGSVTSKPGWDGIHVTLMAGFVDRGTTNGIPTAETKQVTVTGTVTDSVTVTMDWSPQPDSSATTIILEASGGFTIAGTSPRLTATYVKAP